MTVPAVADSPYTRLGAPAVYPLQSRSSATQVRSAIVSAARTGVDTAALGLFAAAVATYAPGEPAWPLSCPRLAATAGLTDHQARPLLARLVAAGLLVRRRVRNHDHVSGEARVRYALPGGGR